MLARKCDFCGGFYEHYEGCNHKENANAITLITRELTDDWVEHDTYDLCPNCMCKILAMMRKER